MTTDTIIRALEICLGDDDKVDCRECPCFVKSDHSLCKKAHNQALAFFKNWHQGEWEDINSEQDGTTARRCSCCGDIQLHYQSYLPNYCPNCGAYMKGDKNE